MSDFQKFFPNDTTFGTQLEGYKLHVPVYHSNATDKWDVSCLMFLSTETKEKVEAGIAFFKESLDSLYNINSVGIKMMHKSLVTKHFQSESIGEIHEDSSDDLNLNESVEMFNDEGGANSRLASPGMKHLLEEQFEANERIPKNVKFNRAFEIAKVTAEYMKERLIYKVSTLYRLVVSEYVFFVYKRGALRAKCLYR